MRIKLKKIFIFVFFYLYFFNLFSIETKIIVKVNNDFISNYELKNKILTTLFLSNETLNQENINKTKPLVLSSMIDLKLKKNEIEKNNIKINELEIIRSLNSISNGDLNSFKTKFDINNLDFENYKEDLKIEIGWRKFIFKKYNKKVKINESEIKSELQLALENYGGSNISYNLYEILINYSNSEDKNEKLKNIKNSIKEIGFEQTAKKFSVSLNNNSGDLGWINAKSLSKNIYDEIKSLDLNEITNPIFTNETILFLKLKGKRENNLNEVEINNLKKNIINTKENQIYNLYSNSHLSKLKNLANIEYK